MALKIDPVTKTEPKTDVVHNELNTTRIEQGVLLQKYIVDKYSKSVTEFVTISNTLFGNTDWFTKETLLSILDESKGKTTIDYKLKSSSIAEGTRKAQDGKAIQINFNEKDVTILVYVQSSHDKSKKWRYSHGYKIDKNTFDAYTLVITNDANVVTMEQKAKAKENASLNLG